jgi:hypothetical protein
VRLGAVEHLREGDLPGVAEETEDTRRFELFQGTLLLDKLSRSHHRRFECVRQGRDDTVASARSQTLVKLSRGEDRVVKAAGDGERQPGLHKHHAPGGGVGGLNSTRQATAYWVVHSVMLLL